MIVLRHVWLPALAVILISQGTSARDGAKESGGCYSIIVGRAVSAAGGVIMAHNEDDFIPQVVNHRRIPRASHGPEEVVRLTDGGTLAQVPQTWAYIWSEMPGLLFSDSYLNEWGVCVCSNACPSREDHPELTDGGITDMLRRIVAERARSAREGVRIAGELAERFGYGASGRTYTISDPQEGWLFCAVNGKHWVAQRVPDNRVALIANTYTVHDVNLADTVNYLGSLDLIAYAVSRGWYDPQADGPFDFAEAYADPEVAADPRNVGRQWDGIRRVAADPPKYGEPLPFSVAPKGKLGVGEVMQVLRSHYEDTELYATDSIAGCPHGQPITPICRHDTQTSFVAQLRGGLPSEIGLVYWVCLSSPCVSAYVPFYFGVDSFPTAYAGSGVPPTEEEYAARVAGPFAVDTTSAFWTFTGFRHHAEQRYTDVAAHARHLLEAVESQARSRQIAVEKAALHRLERDRAAAVRSLADFSNEVYAKALHGLRQMKFGK